ncbi:putative mmc protein [Botrytis fragariae]|uniref:Putative mmc protein n=1 Tax=Botrytis fragariae TaxID=1964551 RepID=A0A8H6EFE1_9HELO|nr:putative mmc protein [Botrytis fragariae]KAF5869865.1 putative mmc protein [Botrytis fragariae]
MQFSTVAMISALAVSASAYGNSSIAAVWVTDVVTSFVTVCPAATSFSFNGVTYTATESETVTITNCPCTISKPVYTTSSVICNTCTAAPTAPVSSAAISSAPAWGNNTAPAATGGVTTSKGSVGTTSAPAGSSPSASTTAPIVVSNNGNRAIALSGASLAGLLGVAAYIL